jgi:hypothetical protein
MFAANSSGTMLRLAIQLISLLFRTILCDISREHDANKWIYKLAIVVPHNAS